MDIKAPKLLPIPATKPVVRSATGFPNKLRNNVLLAALSAIGVASAAVESCALDTEGTCQANASGACGTAGEAPDGGTAGMAGAGGEAGQGGEAGSGGQAAMGGIGGSAGTGGLEGGAGGGIGGSAGTGGLDGGAGQGGTAGAGGEAGVPTFIIKHSPGTKYEVVQYRNHLPIMETVTNGTWETGDLVITDIQADDKFIRQVAPTSYDAGLPDTSYRDDYEVNQEFIDNGYTEQTEGMGYDHDQQMNLVDSSIWESGGSFTAPLTDIDGLPLFIAYEFQSSGQYDHGTIYRTTLH
jgi:hypothetical protein